jgi:hypothetical protein
VQDKAKLHHISFSCPLGETKEFQELAHLTKEQAEQITTWLLELQEFQEIKNVRVRPTTSTSAKPKVTYANLIDMIEQVKGFAEQVLD